MLPSPDITWRTAEDIPEQIFVDLFSKAVPREDAGERFIYCEASNGALDLQREEVLQKALHESRDYFLARGNVDLDHFTVIGSRMGLANPWMYEVGRPVEVRDGCDGGCTFVKCRIYRGQPIADWFWSTLESDPPRPWFPSVAGSILDKSTVFDPKLNMRKGVIKRVLWSNLAMAGEPVNETVAGISRVPFGSFSKSFAGSALCDFRELTHAVTPEQAVRVLTKSHGSACGCGEKCECAECKKKRQGFGKALEAGTTVDPSALIGGGALRMESLSGAPARTHQGASDLRALATRFLGDLKKGRGPERVTLAGIQTWMVANYGIDRETAVAASRNLLDTLAQRRRQRAA
jgi:hypothetical protein